MKRFLSWLLLNPGEELIRVKSWVPGIGKYGIEWPTMLINMPYDTRQTVSPVWNRARLRGIGRG